MTVLLVHSAESCVRLANSVQHLVLKIPESADLGLHYVLDRFTCCIMQQPIKFESHGLFEFDVKFFKMMITGFVTYMVMFIPFSSDVPEIGAAVNKSVGRHCY
ncbi:uncharacterized protein LOC129731261 isoform X2 [Wyeomyia smithii]|nr:uncharacterized protein LOC129731261 isoform X2 [Wyeomyia smithii]